MHGSGADVRGDDVRRAPRPSRLGEVPVPIDGRSGTRWSYRELRGNAEAVGSALRAECGGGHTKFAAGVARLGARTLVVGEAYLEVGRRLLAETGIERLLVCAPPGVDPGSASGW